MNNITIRKATPGDAASIATIHVKTWQYAYNGQIPSKYLDNLSVEQRTISWKKHLEEPKEKAYTLVIERNKYVVGWCSLGVNRDDDLSPEVGELYAIYMHPDSIGKGLGTQLIEYALNILKQDGYKKATLWVLTTNDKTRKFYEKNGWVIEGKTKVDKRDGFDLQETRYIKEFL